MTDSNLEFRVPEAIRFDNAAKVRAAGEQFVDDGPANLRFSLGQLEENNSVVVATLLAWVRRARACDKALQFVDVPDDLRSIINLYGVTDILPLEPGAAGPEPVSGATGAARGQASAAE